MTLLTKDGAAGQHEGTVDLGDSVGENKSTVLEHEESVTGSYDDTDVSFFFLLIFASFLILD